MEISTKKPKGIFTIETPTKKKAPKEKEAKLGSKKAPVVAERYRPGAAAERRGVADRRQLDANKIRLFDLMERADRMERLRMGVHYRFTSALPYQLGFGAPSDRTGVEFSIVDTDDETVTYSLFPESSDIAYGNLERALDRMQQEYDEQQEAKIKQDALLRTLTEEQRAILGFFHWTDPEADSK
jgi:hypothetical protein